MDMAKRTIIEALKYEEENKGKPLNKYASSRSLISIRERFWSKVSIGNEDDCWNWTGGTNSWGYGQFTVEKIGLTMQAPRVAWELWNNKQADSSLDCLHSCDNRLCCNPKHLSLGTPKQNMDDKYSRGRANLKLSENQALEIKELYKTGKYTCNVLGEMFGVSGRKISDVINNNCFKFSIS